MSIHKFDTIKEKLSETKSNLYLALEKLANESNADLAQTTINWYDEDKLNEVKEEFVAYMAFGIKRVKSGAGNAI